MEDGAPCNRIGTRMQGIQESVGWAVPDFPGVKGDFRVFRSGR